MIQKNKIISFSHPILVEASFILFGIALLFGCSQIAIPLQPVPITLQTVGVIFIILTCSTQRAVQTILAYILLGALGAPLFSGYRGGLAIILGPTGGYILGFLLAAIIANPVKKILDSYGSIIEAFVLSSLVTLIIMSSGLFWLSIQIGFGKAVEIGFIPFVIPGLIKAGLLSLILRSIGYFKN